MLPSIINARLSDRPDIGIITAAYDDTSSYARGAAKGPAKVIGCLDSQVEIFDPFHKRSTSYELSFAHEDLGKLNGKKPEEVMRRIKERYAHVLAVGAFPLLIGGENSVSIGALAALAETVPPQDVTIVQVDAHLDLRFDDSDYHARPTPFAHCSVMRRAHEMGYRLVHVGARSYSQEEYEYAMGNPDTITVFPWRSTLPTIEAICASITTDKVYFMIDIDGIDPSHLPGTGTPVPGGLSWYYFFDLMRELFHTKQVIAADITEIAPQRESVITEYGAAQIAYTLCGYVGKRS